MSSRVECWVWVRVKDVFELIWEKDNKVSESESNMAEFKMAAIIKLSENAWVKFFLCKWTSLSEFVSGMAESKMAELAKFKMAAIIKLSQNEWVWVRLKFESESEWSESVFEWKMKITRYLNPRWQCLNPTWQNSRWLPSSSWVRMNEFESDWTSLSQSFVQNGWIQDGRIQDGRIEDGCHH